MGVNAMTDEVLCAIGVRDAVAARGFSTARSDGQRVMVSELAMDFVVTEAKRLHGDAGFGVAIDARARGRTSPGMQVTVVGVGHTLELAARDAGEQWALNVLPVLVSFLRRETGRHEVLTLPMVVGDKDSGDRFGWTVRLGPVVTRHYLKDGVAPPSESPSQEIYFRSLFDLIHPYAARTTPLWVECFAIHHDGGGDDATCRLLNDPWPEGRAALLATAALWALHGCNAISRRQFIILDPTPLAELPARQDLAAELDKHMPTPSLVVPTPWWRRLLGRR